MTHAGSDADDPDVLLHVDDIVVSYGVSRRRPGVEAVSGVSFDVRRGETLALVGESGCGKSTLARAIAMLTPPTAGCVSFEGRDLTKLSPGDLRRTRVRLQMIFQDPSASLNARRRVRSIVAEGLSINKVPKPWTDRIEQVLISVGIDPTAMLDRHPYELSGGQCQRVAIARALILDPALLICDEPVSSLDVSMQAQILNLFEDMKARYGLTMLFISHDLGVVKSISDRVAVMYLGKLCEIGPSDPLYEQPQHPYTQALLDAVEEPNPLTAAKAMRLSGDLPSPLNPPTGCRFRTRCPRAQELCATEEPKLRELSPGRHVACHFPGPDT
jgi:peptide/nickel transport system ATP-binding protein